MNFEFGESESDLFQKVSEVMQTLGQKQDLESTDQDNVAANIQSALTALAPLGYLHLGLAPHPSGLKGMLALMRAMEEVARVAPSVFLGIEMSTRLFGRIVSEWCQAEQKSIWLSPLLEGHQIGAVALSETSMNIDNAPLQTSAYLEGDSVVLSGGKTYVVNAAIADWIAVAGLIENQPAFFIVSKETPGLKITRRLTTLGYEGAVLNDLALDQCRLPQHHVIGPFNNQPILEAVRLWENQILLGASLGLMGAALQAAQAHANAHHTGGKPIIAYQEVAFKLAEMLTLLQTAQLLAYRTAWTADTAPAEAPSLTLCAKVFCTEAAEKVASSALQILAGAGYTADNPAERAYRCAKYGQIAGTSTEIARVKIGDGAMGKR
jgi:alkylation response protein AidB-like acyl-CoA dehydrogenase